MMEAQRQISFLRLITTVTILVISVHCVKATKDKSITVSAREGFIPGQQLEKCYSDATSEIEDMCELDCGSTDEPGMSGDSDSDCGSIDKPGKTCGSTDEPGISGESDASSEILDMREQACGSTDEPGISGDSDATSENLDMREPACSSTDEPGISGDSDATSEILDMHEQACSSTDEPGISCDSDSTSGEMSNDVECADDVEVVRLQLPPAKHVNRFFHEDISYGNRMKTKALSLLSIKSACKEKCGCSQECIKDIDFKTIREIRKAFWTKSKPARMELLKTLVSESVKLGKYRFVKIQKWTFCSRAFCSVLRINKNTFSRAIGMDYTNSATISGRKPRNLAESSLHLMNWLETYATYHGDRMPDVADIYLPYKTIKVDLYWKYTTETSLPVSKSQFFKTWSSYFPHLKIKKTNSFSKCTTCTTLERQLAKTTCAQTRLKYKQLREEHNKRQMLERKYYYGKREASRREPQTYLSMIIDGMDQSKTNLPHFKGRLPKNIREGDLLKTHITGVISHGHGGFQTFLDLNEYPHDPNLTLNILLKMLKKTADLQGNVLPPVLYIQADNCGRENKNRFVLAFCELLVGQRIFTEVHLSFLHVGHTHEDVDAAFSRVAGTLRKTDVETIKDLLNILPKSETVGDMFDIKTWLDPHINPLYGVSSPLHYKFHTSHSKVETLYKRQYQSAWIPLEGCILDKFPSGRPVLLKPDFLKIDSCTQLKQLQTIKHMFFKEDSITVWEDFHKKISKNTMHARTRHFPAWILEELPRQGEVLTDEAIIPEDVIQLAEKDQALPKVIVKKRKTVAKRKETLPAQRNNNSDKTRKVQKKKGKTGGGKKKQPPANRTVMIYLDDERKKHIWFMIFMDMFQSFIILFWYTLILLSYLRLLCLLELIYYLKQTFLLIMLEHLGSLTHMSVYSYQVIRQGQYSECCHHYM